MDKNVNRELVQEQGFALIIIPILFLLFGFFMTSIQGAVRPSSFYFESATEVEMSDVRKALSVYVHKNYHVPCPADPAAANFGFEDGGLNTNRECSRTTGILPFRTLGLPESAARDEWGYYYTYRISPSFSRRIDDDEDITYVDSDVFPTLNSDSENFVHEMCRTDGWINRTGIYNDLDGNNSAPLGVEINRNIYKAGFCCASIMQAGGGGKSYDFSEYENELNTQYQTGLNGAFVGDMDVSVGLVEANGILTNGGNNFYLGLGQTALDASGGDLVYTRSEEGNGIGLNTHGGKLLYQNLTFNFNDSDEKEVKPNKVHVDLADVGLNNFGAALPVKMDIYDGDGNYIDTVEYVAEIPIPTQFTDPHAPGYLETTVTVSVDDILNDDDQSFLWDRSFMEYADYCSTYPGLSGCFNQESNLKNALKANAAQVARDQYDAERADFLTKLTAAGKTPDDVGGLHIKNLTVNALLSSLLVKGVGTESSGELGNDDLVVLDEGENSRLEERDNEVAYGTASTPVDPSDAVDQDFEAPAYVLISHGADGEGAFQRGGGRIDNVLDAQENPQEVFNHSDDGAIYDTRKIVSDVQADKFDDIILWDSQFTLYNALRNGSCETAQAL